VLAVNGKSSEPPMGDNRPPSEPPHGDCVNVATEFFALAHSLKRMVNARCKAAGLSYARVQVLHVLDEWGTTRIGDISDHLDVAARTMTSTVDAMVRDGLVARRTDPRDGRAVLVEMTPAGRDAFDRVTAIRDAVLAEVFASLGPDDRDRLLGLVRALAGEAVGD
jgi:DNA-binding MarR family transcriptional regulator